MLWAMNNDTPPSVEDVNAYMAGLENFTGTSPIVAERIESRDITVRWTYDENALRPGGYIPGPALFSIADIAGWVLVFSTEGITPMAVTWDLHITFLRPAMGGDIVAHAKQLKRGRKLMYGDVTMFMVDDPDTPVAHATLTYALPSSD